MFDKLKKLIGRHKMETEVKEMSINGVVYVPKSDVLEKSETVDGMKYVIVRTYSAGVFAGYLESRNGREVVMKKARRIWYWDGAASLSQLATEGTSKPENCKFPCEVSRIELFEVVEILDVTKKSEKSLKAVSVWKK